MSSPFQKQFSAKTPIAAPSPSPLNGAYASGADGMVTVSDAGHFQKLQDDIVSAVDKSVVRPKVSKCDMLRNNWHGGKMTDKAYADASKDCGKTEGKDKNELTKFDSDLTGDKKDPYNLTAKMEKNTGLTNKQSIEQRVGKDLSNKFNVGNTYQ